MAEPHPPNNAVQGIALNLEPAKDQMGDLRSFETMRIAESQRRSSPFTYEVEIINEVHGKLTEFAGHPNANTSPASLLLIRTTIKSEDSARLRQSWVEFVFRDPGDPKTARIQPEVTEYELGKGVPLRVKDTPESRTQKKHWKVDVSVDAAGHGGAGGQFGNEQISEKVLVFSSTVSSKSESEHGLLGDPHNVVRWHCKENESQMSGVPPSLVMGILLKRNEGPFTVEVGVRLEANWFESVKSWFSQFIFWVKRQDITIDPSKPKTLPPPPPANIVPDNLELLVVDENRQLKSFCRIRMPEEYVLESEQDSGSKDEDNKSPELGKDEDTGEAED